MILLNASLERIKYKPLLSELKEGFDLQFCDINTLPSTCLVTLNQATFALSKWVSPKRTRSYPYERVYNSLGIAKKITVIPIVKDEGAKGDRDFLQWDTVSLMSLLDVYVIFTHYNTAKKKGLKITGQKFDSVRVKAQIEEISNFHSSALHWNLDKIAEIDVILAETIVAYTKIELETGVVLHDIKGIENFRNRLKKDVSAFMLFSREKARQAQARETVTVQPKEALSKGIKGALTITNYLGGTYYFTVDEVEVVEDKVFLIEGKHAKNKLIPSKGDIKDGLIKMILYSNLSEIKCNDKQFSPYPVLKLTSHLLKSELFSFQETAKAQTFFTEHKFRAVQQKLIETLFMEAKENGFVVHLQPAI